MNVAAKSNHGAVMATPSPAPKTVLETILEWSQGRPAWQRDALRRIVSKGHLDDTDIQELVSLCKQGRGDKSVMLAVMPLDKSNLPANPGQADSVSLTSIERVVGVNMLAPEQSLTFAPTGLTIIYGDNGAGKSGYARILKRACRARHAGKIEPNAYGAIPAGPASAILNYSIGGKAQPPEEWQNGEHPHAMLSAISVFDADSGSVHIKEKNEVAFRPFGIDIPDELANTCQRVKDTLASWQQKLEASRHPIFVTPTWKSATTVGKALSNLRHDTDPEPIEALAKLSDEEASRLARLKQDLARDPTKAAAEETLKADNLKLLIATLRNLHEKTTDEALANVLSLARQANEKRDLAKLAADKAFSNDPLKDVGSETWRALWEAARRYSIQSAYPGQPFPVVGDNSFCVLCQQPLEADAQGRLQRFEEFIRQDTERQAQDAAKASAAAIQELQALTLMSVTIKNSLKAISIENAELAKKVRRFMASVRLRRFQILRTVKTGIAQQLPNSEPSPETDLAKVETATRQRIDELRKSVAADARKKLEAELAELTDRQLLGGLLQTAKDEIARLKTIHFLVECQSETATNAITILGNSIADTVITPKLRDRFQQEIVRLTADKVRVEIVRSGGKYGSPQYQVRLFAKPEAKVQDILSEGEKTCVALAAFLTELATATHQSSLVFDDPVSSLDHRWRTQVAKRLVEEGGQRQVIVFTHDLIFVNDLIDLAEDKKTPVTQVTVARGQAGSGVVSDGLPWIGKRVEHRIDQLEKDARDAKKLNDESKEEEYKQAAVDIYTLLRSAWERALEEVAFQRVVQRHRDYINAKDLKKVSVLTEPDCDAFHAGFKKCSNIVDAHDPSSGRNPAPPPPAEIFDDIQALKDWVSGLRDRQKKIA